MTYALLGLSLGLGAGIAPGPLLALVIQRSVQGGLGSGLRVALAPLLSDLPIVALAFILVGRLPQAGLDVMLGIGGIFVVWLGIDAWRGAGHELALAAVPTPRQDLLHGVIINFLNPHPYLFWAAVGAPTVLKAWGSEPAAAIAFVVAFYTLLIGSKVTLAVLFSRARRLSPDRHRLIIRFSALLLFLAGLFMLATAGQALLIDSQ